MKKATLFPLGLLVAGLILAGSVSAFHFPMWGHPGIDPQTNEQLNTALKNRDYSTYMSVRSTQWPNAPRITEDQFNQLAEKYSIHSDLEAAIEGNDYARYTQIMGQYFPTRSKMTQEDFSKVVERNQYRKNIEAAISSGNYDQWKTLIQQNPSGRTDRMLASITAENFHLLKDLQDARTTHDAAKIKEIMNQLGLTGMHHVAHPSMGHAFG